jgi:hypothetical protein
MYKKHEEYIDTSSEGNIILVEHNLNTLMPLVALYQPANLSDLKAVSLYDSRISSVESRGPNVTMITFSSAFEGYVQLVDIQNVRTSIIDRIAHLEEVTSLLIQQQKMLTNASQWRQMNTHFESLIVNINNKLVSVDAEISKLKSDIESL